MSIFKSHQLNDFQSFSRRKLLCQLGKLTIIGALTFFLTNCNSVINSPSKLIFLTNQEPTINKEETQNANKNLKTPEVKESEVIQELKNLFVLESPSGHCLFNPSITEEKFILDQVTNSQIYPDADCSLFKKQSSKHLDSHNYYKDILTFYFSEKKPEQTKNQQLKQSKLYENIIAESKQYNIKPYFIEITHHKFKKEKILIISYSRIIGGRVQATLITLGNFQKNQQNN